MKGSKLARIEAFSGDGPAAVWASERRREPSAVRRPMSFASLLDREQKSHAQRSGDFAIAPTTKESGISEEEPVRALAAFPLVQAIEHLPGAVALLDENMVICAASRGWAIDLKLNMDAKIVGASFYDFFEDCANYWQRQHEAVLAGETITGARDTFERPDGLVLTLERTMVPVRTPKGRVVGMLMALTIEELAIGADQDRSRDILRFLEDR